MRLDPELGYVLDDGQVVRIESVFDVYDGYYPETEIGENPTAYVRYSHWWNESRVIAPRTERADLFVQNVDRVVDAELLPVESGPNETPDL
jgi:hypothetical protein